jgi:A/G-specific adenine glycosylase
LRPCQARAAILDGNVKRVLARHLGAIGYPGEKKIEEWLWERASGLLPKSGIESYTQGLMDLGATLCTRSRPNCAACPVRVDCVAWVEGRTEELPHRKPRKEIPQRACVMPILLHAGEVLLEKRRSPGIWGGLWCLPQFDNATEAKLALGLPASVWRARQVLEPVEHGFTHFRLTIEPLLFSLSASAMRSLDATDKPRSGRIWLPLAEASTAALPAPVKKLLGRLAETTSLHGGPVPG